MEGQRKRAVALCQTEGCEAQAKQKCRLCTLDCCAAHGHWTKAMQLGSLRGVTPPDASLWLCTSCWASLRLAVPPNPNPRHRSAVTRVPASIGEQTASCGVRNMWQRLPGSDTD